MEVAASAMALRCWIVSLLHVLPLQALLALLLATSKMADTRAGASSTSREPTRDISALLALACRCFLLGSEEQNWASLRSSRMASRHRSTD